MTASPGLLVLHLAPSLLAAMILARACAFKLRDLIRFEGVVANYRLAPPATAPLIARGLPVAEILLAVALLAPWTRSVADMTAAALFVVFGLAVGVNIVRGRREIDCGCGDPAHRQPLSWSLVGRNVALAALLIAAGLAPHAVIGVGGLVVSLAAALAGFLLILCQEAFQALPGRDAGQARRARLILQPEARG